MISLFKVNNKNTSSTPAMTKIKIKKLQAEQFLQDYTEPFRVSLINLGYIHNLVLVSSLLNLNRYLSKKMTKLTQPMFTCSKSRMKTIEQ